MIEEQMLIVAHTIDLYGVDRAGTVFKIESISYSSRGGNHFNLDIDGANYAVAGDKYSYGDNDPTSPPVYRSMDQDPDKRYDGAKKMDVVAFFEGDPRKDINKAPIFAFDHVKFN